MASSSSSPTTTTAPLLRLWGSSRFRSGRCLWMLEELGVAYEHRDVSSRDGTTGTAEFLALNRHGKIPVLEDRAAGLVLNESVAINTYLCDRFGPDHRHTNKFVPRPGTIGRASYDSVCQTIMTELDAQGLYIHRKHVGLADTYGEAPVAVEAAKRYFQKHLAALAQSRLIEPGNTYLLGGDFGAADVLMGHVLVWASTVGWLPTGAGAQGEQARIARALRAYLDRVTSRPAYQRAFDSSVKKAAL